MLTETEKVRGTISEQRIRKYSSTLYPLPPVVPTNNVNVYTPNKMVWDYYDVYSTVIDKSYVLSLFQSGNTDNKYCRAIKLKTHLDGRDDVMEEWIETIYDFEALFYNIRRFTRIVPHSTMIISTSRWYQTSNLYLQPRPKILAYAAYNLSVGGIMSLLSDGHDGNKIARTLNRIPVLMKVQQGVYMRIENESRPIRILGQL